MLIGTIDCSPAVCRLRDWHIADVLPVWLETAYDPVRDHFHEGLELDGTPLASPVLRTRSAARMIFTYADAARLGVAPKGALDTALKAARALDRDAGIEGGGYARAFDRKSGQILDPVRDLYDQACALMAFSALYRVTGDAWLLARVEDLLATIDTVLAASGGGWAEDENHTLPRRQNPHMHLFEALTILARASGQKAHRDRLAAVGMLLKRRFLDNEGLLREFFGPNWELAPEWRSERLDPGHMSEWSWLLSAAGNILGDFLTETSELLITRALELGRAPDDPRFLVDEVDSSGHPLSNGRRLWLQAELIKASLATGRVELSEQTAAGLFETYLAQTPRGTWRDRFDLKGNMIATTVPASSCYHLWTVVAATLPKAAAA